MKQSTGSLVVLTLLGVTSLALAQDHHSIGIDVSGCQVCDSRYTDWARNRTRQTYWESHESSQAAADHLCQWTSDIYYQCFSVCAIDTNNNTVPFTSDRRPQTLKKYLDENCLDGECRLADQMICRYAPPKSKCDPTVLDCKNQMVEKLGCDMEKMCTETERRAFIDHMETRMDCFVSYPGNKIDGRSYTIAQEQGLQHCKDMILTQCLATWSVDEYDWIRLANYSEETKQEFCSGKPAVMKCMVAVLNGTLTYRGGTYTSPCQQDLLSSPEHLDLTFHQVQAVYERLCSDLDPCAEPTTTTTTTTAKPTTKIVVVKDPEFEHGVHITGGKAKEAQATDGDGSTAAITAASKLTVLALGFARFIW